MGRIALLLIPRFDSQLYQEPETLLGELGQALQTAAQLGAQTVSLTGLLPSATRYGMDLQQALGTRPMPRITTGHATTAAAVALAVRRIVSDAGRSLTGERIGFVGLGSVGTASLRTILQCLPHPAEICLCDVYSKREHLLALQRELTEKLGYGGNVRVLEARGCVPPGVYESSLLIGATNVPDILDVDRLAPGTLLVDDSSPHCFRLDRAAQRIRDRQDILFTAGGMLQTPEPHRQLIYVPSALDRVLKSAPAELFANYDPHHITGCVLSALLSVRWVDLAPTVGLVGAQAGLDHYAVLERLGIQAAALHCEEYALERDVILSFRSRFGGDGQSCPAAADSREGVLV